VFARSKIILFIVLLPLLSGCNPFSYGSESGLSASFAGLASDGAKVSADSKKIVLTWSAAVNPTGSVHYFIYGDAAFTELLDITDQTTWTFNDPVPGQSYVFGVRARDDAGMDTNLSLCVVHVDLNAPTFAGLASATATSSSKIQLTWSASPSSDVAGYNIYLSRDLVNAIDFTTNTQHFVTGLTASTAYNFVVRAMNSAGITDQNIVAKGATTLSYAVPDFSGVTSVSTMAGAAGLTSLTVDWTRAGGSVTGYQIYASTTSHGQDFLNANTPVGGNTANATVGPYIAGATTTTAVIDGLSANTTYYVSVRAFYWDGTNNYEETNTIEKSATTLATIPPPTPPVLISISPSAGQIGGGDGVVITGTGFIDGISKAVTIGGSSCAPMIVVSGTQITCTTTAHAAGTVDVVVTNGDGGSATLTNAWTYTATPPPVVSSIAPTSGAAVGGTAVTITGTGFTAGVTIKIGGSTCTGPVVGSSTSITCTTSSHAQGSTDIVVTNTDTQKGTLVNGFGYVAAPTITSMSPTVGALAGATTITLTGTNFRVGATITVGGSTCTSVIVSTATSARCSTPAHLAGAVSVVLTNNPDGQTATLINGFTYQGAPTVSSIIPAQGALAGGATMTISGSGFAVGSSVTVGATTCTSVVVVNTGSITCTIPAHTPGTVDVIVTNADNQFGSLNSSYIYRAAPTVTGISPSYGLSAGGTVLTITGTNFVNDLTFTSISVGGAVCVASAISATSITCTSGSRAAAAVDVQVINPDSQAGTLTLGFHYTSLPAPTVTSISPALGTTTGGTEVTIIGTGFNNSIVTLGTGGTGYSACNSLVIDSQTQLRCYPATHASGTVNVIVTNDDTQSATLTSAYQYLVLSHQGWSDVVGIGAITPVAGSALSSASAYVTLTWNAFNIAGGIISSYNIYRATSSGGQNYTSPLATGITTAAASYTDNSVVAGTTYYYVVRAVVSAVPLPTAQTYAEIKVIAPPDNMVLVHRWIANQEMCATLQRTADPNNNYRCAYTGPGSGGVYWDLGQSLFIDAYEMGCNFTPSRLGASAPGGGIGAIGDVYYDRSAASCYLKTAGATWRDQSDITLTVAQRGTLSSNQPGLPPLVNLTQAQANDTCSYSSVAGFAGTKRLLSHKEQLIMAAWAPTMPDATVTTIEAGTNLPVNGYCNTAFAAGLTYDNGDTPADLETLPSTNTFGVKSTRTGGTSTANCISRYGARDFVGNVWEWSTDQLASCTAGPTYTCTGSTSNVDTNNNDWATINFDGTVAPGAADVTAVSFAAQSFSASNFLVPLGLPMVTTVASSFDAMQIGGASGKFNSTKFHGNYFWVYFNNANGAPRARAAVAGGSADYGGGRYDLFLGNSPVDTFPNVGMRCMLPAD
jgi:fibronectin type 3 domain-containing protein